MSRFPASSARRLPRARPRWAAAPGHACCPSSPAGLGHRRCSGGCSSVQHRHRRPARPGTRQGCSGRRPFPSPSSSPSPCSSLLLSPSPSFLLPPRRPRRPRCRTTWCEASQGGARGGSSQSGDTRARASWELGGVASERKGSSRGPEELEVSETPLWQQGTPPSSPVGKRREKWTLV